MASGCSQPMLAANLDLEPMNLADQFVLTFLAGDILSWYAGGLPPATGDTRMRCSWPISPSEAPKRSDGRLHTRPFHVHAICESAPPPTTIRKCLDRCALQPGVVIPSRLLLTASRRHHPKTLKLHRTRADTGLFERATCTATLAPFRGEK